MIAVVFAPRFRGDMLFDAIPGIEGSQIFDSIAFVILCDKSDGFDFLAQVDVFGVQDDLLVFL